MPAQSATAPAEVDDALPELPAVVGTRPDGIEATTVREASMPETLTTALSAMVCDLLRVGAWSPGR